MNFSLWRRAFTLALALLLPAWVQAQAPLDAKKSELKELREKLDALRQDIAKGEQTKSFAVDQLRATEAAISTAGRRLFQLGQDQAATRSALQTIEAQQQHLQAQSADQQARLGRLLLQRYWRGEGDALGFLIAGHDPNQIARDQHFLGLLAQARAELITDLRAAAAEKQRLADAAREKSAELADIEKRQQVEHAALVNQRAQRQTMLVSVAQKVAAQRRELGALQRDEARLGKLIDGLIKLAEKRAADKAARARKKQLAERAPPAAPPANKPASGKSARAPTPAPEADETDFSGAFAALKGRLHLPVKGRISGRYGAARADGGATWKGLFIRADEGAQVQAVAPGRVVFADWLRGFGNLLILDHGDGFLSVYGNNEALLREEGATVKSGEAVATVGNSGGNPESGLYFELRHQGRTFDPLKWVGS